jgi:hypothetical protein
MESLPQLTATMKGVSALLCHNGQTADPRNRFSKAMKAISSKRKKVDADFEQMAKLEWTAGLYLRDGRLVLPDHVMESCFIGGAKKSKNGVQAKCGVFFDGDAVLSYDGQPTEPLTEDVLDEMFESGQFSHTVGVKVGMSKVMRCRPVFRNWSAVVTFSYDPDVLNRREVEDIFHDAGRLVGVGDWRPKFGRFEVSIA